MTVIGAVDGTDDDSRVGAQAMKLAEAFDEEIHLVHVLNRDRFVELEQTSIDNSGEAIDIDRIRELAAEIANKTAQSLNGPVQSIGLFGDIMPRLLDYADEVDASYIVVGGRKQSPVGKAVFGDVGQSVILNSNHPVVVVPEEQS